MERIRK